MKTFYFLIIFIVCHCVSMQAQSIACKSDIHLSISEDGTGYITPDAILYSEMNSTSIYTLSRSHFNCADVNNTYRVIVSEYDGSTYINSCWSMITVENHFDGPLPCSPVRALCRDVTLPLRSDGELAITPEILAGGDVNPAFNYAVTPSHFDCSNLGVNTVTVTATSTNNVSHTCTSNITITNPYALFSPCYRLYVNLFRFLPNNIFINHVRPGTPVPFELEIAKSKEIKKQINGELVMVLSKDEEISKDDKVLYTSAIKFNNKDLTLRIKNKFLIPSNVDMGDYYFIMDILSTDKKENLGFKRIINPLTISKSINTTDNRTASFITDDTGLNIFPNPVYDVLNIISEMQNEQQFEIFDTFGKLWLNNNITGSHTQVDIESLPAGMYFLKLDTDGKTKKSFKFIKINK